MSRKVHIDGQQYEYKIGKGNVKVKMPNGQSVVFDHTEITGIADVERASYKGYLHVTPQMIKDATERYLDGYMNDTDSQMKQRNDDWKRNRDRARKQKMAQFSFVEG